MEKKIIKYLIFGSQSSIWLSSSLSLSVVIDGVYEEPLHSNQNEGVNPAGISGTEVSFQIWNGQDLEWLSEWKKLHHF